jgi:RimJ/RimL family protein N-acetyltransferase
MENVSYGIPSITEAEALLVFFTEIKLEFPYLHVYPEDSLNSIENLEQYIHRMNEAETSHIVVARHDHNIVGCVTIEGMRLNEFRDTGELGISVLKQYRGQGVGTCLMEEIMPWARSNNRIHRVILHVDADNEPAIHLYAKEGFRSEGRTDLHPNQTVMLGRMLCMALDL